MAKFNDGYYDPPEEDVTCSICHYGEGYCTCPECTVCGETGNPACINSHMLWEKWGHFQFQLSAVELEAERQEEAARAKLEAEMDKWADELEADPFLLSQDDIGNDETDNP